MRGVKVKPTSAGRRAVVKVVHPHLHKGAGHKHPSRVVDFLRNKDGVPAKVERIEYDPNRTAHIALVCYADGERRYILAPRGLDVGATVVSGAEAPIKAGNTL